VTYIFFEVNITNFYHFTAIWDIFYLGSLHLINICITYNLFFLCYLFLLKYVNFYNKKRDKFFNDFFFNATYLPPAALAPIQKKYFSRSRWCVRSSARINGRNHSGCLQCWHMVILGTHLHFYAPKLSLGQKIFDSR